MADTRETILAACLRIASAIEGVALARRTSVDVPNIARPAILVHDGAETLLDKPVGERLSRVQRMEMAPSIIILVGADAANLGSLLNLYRSRFLSALLTDDELLTLLTPSGEIRYEGCTEDPITAESKEGRMELNIVFTYVFRASDL